MESETDRSAVFGRIVLGLLRPLVRAMIARGVTAPALYRLVKTAYVEVAARDFSIPGERQTDSRISVLTGVHRRDVKALRGDDDEEATRRRKPTMMATVLGRWMGDPALRGEDGAPVSLPRAGDDEPSFESVVRAVSTDVRPRTVLDELRRQNLVDYDDVADIVSLRHDALFGPADQEQKAHFFAENVGDHIAAAVENLLADQPPFMERAVFYNRLTAASVNRIEAEARRMGADSLTRLNALAHELQQTDKDASDGLQRFRYGVFFFREVEGDAQTPATTRDDRREGDA